MPKVNLKKVRSLVLTAYADCHTVKVTGERDLNFKAPIAVSGPLYKGLMREACPEGYNDFDESAAERVVEIFGEDAEYTIAREGSPCVYVKPAKRLWLNRNVELINGLADEVSYEADGQFRIWWD